MRGTRSRDQLARIGVLPRLRVASQQPALFLTRTLAGAQSSRRAANAASALCARLAGGGGMTPGSAAGVTSGGAPGADDGDRRWSRCGIATCAMWRDQSEAPAGG